MRSRVALIAALVLLVILGPFATRIPCFSVEGLKEVAYWISYTQKLTSFIIWVVVIAYLATRKGINWKEVVLSAIALNVAVAALKCVFQSPRPIGVPASLCDIEGLGYPSGHSARAMWVALWIGYLYPQLRIPALIYAFLVGWSRIELCMHYPLDVVGGFLVGFIVFEFLRGSGGGRKVEGSQAQRGGSRGSAEGS
ncbi:hypothetical protein IPA_08425 [Ignicoccus pacificus DSM 13166]|uniref:Phosphatidic acid phosphatase type 2/haloperoxidase domain-containing protein n=1 Tax=Ignicoccus pacificus DSM 13166 TaxID=940294 RepID=A0A977KBT8_9CREN|nr:hypothetical protein IPA_08425 [Ignicoccus pacificus DSM 13166]